MCVIFNLKIWISESSDTYIGQDPHDHILWPTLFGLLIPSSQCHRRHRRTSLFLHLAAPRWPWSPLPHTPTHVHRHSRRKNRTVSEALLDGKWISDIAYNLNSELLKEFFDFWRHMQLLELDLSDDRMPQEDQIIWTLEISGGKYSANSAYTPSNLVDKLSPIFPTDLDYIGDFTLQVLPVWRLLQDRLWTATRLQLRGLKNKYLILCSTWKKLGHHSPFIHQMPLHAKGMGAGRNYTHLHKAGWTDRHNEMEG